MGEQVNKLSLARVAAKKYYEKHPEATGINHATLMKWYQSQLKCKRRKLQL